MHAGWPSYAQAQTYFQDVSRNKPKRELSTTLPPVLSAKRTRAASSTSFAAASLPCSVSSAASSSDRAPKRTAASQTDQQDATLRLLAKMPKLSAKFSYLALQTRPEEGCRKT